MTVSTKAVRQALKIDGEQASIPLSKDATKALETAIYQHGEEIDQALEPYGLGLYDLLPVKYYRVVRPDEINED
jgi:hypothetical protein